MPNIDAASRTSDPNVVGALSDEYITYQSCVHTVTAQNLRITAVSDLKDKEIIAFQGASSTYGPEFDAIVKGSTKYREINDQKIQAVALVNGRAQVAIADTLIFSYWKQVAVIEGLIKATPTTCHKIVGPVSYRMIFKKAQHRDDFNKGLRAIKASGAYAKIWERHTQ